MGNVVCGGVRCGGELECGSIIPVGAVEQVFGIPSVSQVFHSVELVQGVEGSVSAVRVSHAQQYDILLAKSSIEAVFFERSMSMIAVLINLQPEITEHKQDSCELFRKVAYPSWVCFNMQYAVFDPLFAQFKESSLFPLLVKEWPETLPRQDNMGGRGRPEDMVSYMPAFCKQLGTGREINVPLEFKTIQEAVDSAEENDSIKVQPGTYNERLQVTVRVLIEGVVGPKGERPLLVASGNSHVVEFATVQSELGSGNSPFQVNPALMRNCVVQHSGGSSHKEPYGAVLVGPGGVLLEDCHLSSKAGAGLYIEGSGVSCQVSRCRVFECAHAGILVNHCAQVYVNKSSVVQNNTHGICIQRGAQALVSHSYVTGNVGYGIAVVDTHNRGSTATIENNDLQKNEAGAMYIDETALPRVKQLRNTGVD